MVRCEDVVRSEDLVNYEDVIKYEGMLRYGDMVRYEDIVSFEHMKYKEVYVIYSTWVKNSVNKESHFANCVTY